MINTSRIQYLDISESAKKLLAILVEDANQYLGLTRDRHRQQNIPTDIQERVAFGQIDTEDALNKAGLLGIDSVLVLKELAENELIGQEYTQQINIDPVSLREMIAHGWRDTMKARQLKALCKTTYNKSPIKTRYTQPQPPVLA